jgi:hypothetical protein
MTMRTSLSPLILSIAISLLVTVVVDAFLLLRGRTIKTIATASTDASQVEGVKAPAGRIKATAWSKWKIFIALMMAFSLGYLHQSGSLADGIGYGAGWLFLPFLICAFVVRGKPIDRNRFAHWFFWLSIVALGFLGQTTLSNPK